MRYKPDLVILPIVTTRVLAFVVASLLIGACGVPSNGDVMPISKTELPPELNEVKIAPTTTSTIVPESAKETEASIAEVANETVELYFISANRVVATSLSIASPATTSQVLASLVSGPPSGDTGLGLRSALPPSLEASVTVLKGIAQIDTSGQFLALLTPIDQRLAIAQLVMTFTRRPGVGQVIFSVDGQVVAVPRGRGDLSQPGSAVSFDDYSSLLVEKTS